MTKTPESTARSAALKRALQELRELRTKLAALEQAQAEPIAIVGMGCRFPGGATNLAAYWDVLAEGRDTITEVPADRWDVDAIYDPDPAAAGKTYARWGGFVKEIDAFDATFFGISPREAVHMDPQQRVVLEVAWEALEDAGVIAPHLSGSPTGVFLGLHRGEYGELRTGDLANLDIYSLTGTGGHTAAGRLSYLLDLRGPSMAVDTACSSSLVAVHLACQSLRSGESALALAGGVNIILSPALTLSMSRMRALAPDGRCKAFDARADGFVSSEGCGIVVLKRLSDARRDGDRIHAVIRGTAVNQDGLSAGLTAPNGAAQQAVIHQALRSAHVDAAQVTYIEAHGTGTSLGDPIEVDALAATYGRAGTQPCALGSAKANIGHLESAAGIAGLIKAVLTMQHGTIPANIHLRTLNPSITLDGTRLTLPTALQPWDGPRLAAVSSFGISGTNAHAILEECAVEPDAARPATEPNRPYLLPLSAKNPQALDALAQRYQAFLQTADAPPLGDICSTASLRRTHHAYRLAVAGRTHADLAQALQEAGSAPPSSAVKEDYTPRLVFVFPGQGGQWVRMGQQLLQSEPVFRAAINACAVALQPYVDWSLLDVLNAAPDQAALRQIDVIQPTLFAIQVALAALWRAWGVEPDAVIGHSMGEVAAAAVAGALTLDDAARIICRRSQLMHRTSGQGAMAVVGLAAEQARTAINGTADHIAVAVCNSPTSTVLSGDPAHLAALLTDLQAQNIFCRSVQVDVASHSPQMDPLVPALVRDLATIQPHPAPTRIYSTVTGGTVAGDALTAAYWGNNLRQPVQFAQAVQQAAADGHTLFVEISPHPTLNMALQETFQQTDLTCQAFASLRRDADEPQALLQTMGALYASGYPVAWSTLSPDGAHITLPTYPWQRQRYWVDGAAAPGLHQHPTVPAPAATPEVFADWLYETTWQPLEPVAPMPADEPGFWLLLADASGVAEELKSRLEAQGESCHLITPSCYKTQRAPALLSDEVESTQPAWFEQLLQAIFAETTLPCRGIVHLWSLDTPMVPMDMAAAGQIIYNRGCGSLLATVQALAQTGWSTLPRLWVVTNGAQRVGTPDEKPTIASAPLLGLARVIMNEYPPVQCTCIDLDRADVDAAHRAETLLMALHANDSETEVAWRGGTRYGARLAQVTLPPPSTLPVQFGSDATYLITGGLGGIGAVLAHWLIERGAQHLVLTGRRQIDAPTAAAAAQTLAALRATGARIDYYPVDVANRAQVADLIGRIAETLPPLRGVFHAAGVLDDSILLNLSHDQFQRALAPKVLGSWNLHTLTRHLPLDHFALFSSASALLGVPGQGNYAAANAFLDALAHYRRSLGLSALSINWGAWADVGLVTAQAELGDHLAQRGLAGFVAADGLRAFERLLQDDRAQVGVMALDAQQWQQCHPNARTAYFSLLAQEAGEPDAAPLLRDELLATPAGRWRRTLLETYLCQQVAHTLRCSPDQVATDAPLFTLGFDSLLGVEFANRIRTATNLALAATLIWTYPTVALLAEHLAERLDISLTAEAVQAVPQTSGANQPAAADSLDDLLTNITGMSDTEISSLLARSIGS